MTKHKRNITRYTSCDIPWVKREEAVQGPQEWALAVHSSSNAHYAAQAFFELRHMYVRGVCYLPCLLNKPGGPTF